MFVFLVGIECFGKVVLSDICFYYMASSLSRQDKPNRALWLATQAGKMELFHPLGTTRHVLPQKPNDKSFIDQAFLVKMAGYWPRSFFCELMDLDFVSVHKHAKKKELGQYPAILTSGLVNNLYLWTSIKYYLQTFTVGGVGAHMYSCRYVYSTSITRDKG